MNLKGEIIMYYLAIVQNDTTNALYSYNSYESALAAYHTELAYRAEGRTSTKCAILDHDLNMLRQETYIAPAPNAEPEGE
jgi:hypothetical protein